MPCHDQIIINEGNRLAYKCYFAFSPKTTKLMTKLMKTYKGQNRNLYVHRKRVTQKVRAGWERGNRERQRQRQRDRQTDR